jgi:hypothetical protein
MAVPQPQPGTTPGFHVAIRSGRRYSATHRRQLPLPFRPAGGLPKQPPTGWNHVGVTNVGCRHIYMQRQPLVELFDNIYYNRTVYTDVLE